MPRTKRILLILVLIVAGSVLYLLLWPVPIRPAAWTPPQAPRLTGPYEKNSKLAGTQRLSLGAGFAPEDVALDAAGNIYAGFDDGRIIRLRADGTSPEVFANTQGRPLGLVFDRAGNLLVADAIKGLLSITADAQVHTLTTESEGIAFHCANDLDVAADGTIYFTDASSKFPLTNFKADILEHQPNGRLLSFEPGTKTTRTLLSNLYFANGVAVSPDQSFLLVVDTGAYRVWRVWLKGPQEGKIEGFIENLPGFPDGITSNGRDRFWLALVTPRDAVLDKLMPHPMLRKVVMRLPGFLQPAPKRYSFVLGLDANGRVVENLQDGSPECYAEIANVVEHNGMLYFGSIGESTVGRFKLR
ncbi:MAG TPA: SMP-30/gluconolactonase/LRE family protein [Pyrinomonadaceae bacterium]|nr:SMP-30/gluconolactonase/LRE family protein [Pyrinomonadaceae bacterium]